MIRKTLMISAAVLALAGCDNGPIRFGGGGQAEAGADTPAARQFRHALAQAPKHGLTTDLFFKGDPASAGEGELREAVLSLASALAMGKTDPTKIRDVYTLPRPKVDVRSGFDQALAEDRLVDWLNSLAPQTDEYRALSNAFVQLVERVPNLAGTSIPANDDVIEPGDSDPRVPAIVENLRAQGYLPAAAPAEAQQPQQAQPQAAQGQQGEQQAPQPQPPTEFTEQMSKALAQWQEDSGLKPDGVVGRETVAQLNAGPKDRARKLAVAMERLRWLERDAPPTRIDVNTAAAFLEYYRDGRKVDQRNVVVGEPGWETPQLASPIYALVANPDWVVPESIVEDEIAGKSSAWLRRNNFSQKDGRWVQEPGPESALGLVKFAMENDQSIYLHDTPHKGLFSQDNRHESHGCVRVHNAVQFAQTLAQQNGILPKFQQAMQKDDETQVQLPAKIPVRLMYHTAFLASNGRIQFAEDVYGWDNDVATALGYERTEAPQDRRTHAPGDIGP